MKTSITFAHYNRPLFLERTLEAYINIHPNLEDVEFVVVDDNSTDTAENVCKKFDNLLNICYYYIDDKKGYGCSTAINLGAKYAKGENLFIANPECLPISPIIDEANQKLTNNNYISYQCYSIDEEGQNRINELQYSTNYVEEIKQLIHFNDYSVGREGDSGWYNHPLYRPVALHFTSAIKRENFLALGGFDEIYEQGTAYDDNDFLRRIVLSGLNVEISEGVVLHQNHYKDSWIAGGAIPNIPSNVDIFHRKCAENNIKAEQSLLYNL